MRHWLPGDMCKAILSHHDATIFDAGACHFGLDEEALVELADAVEAAERAAEAAER